MRNFIFILLLSISMPVLAQDISRTALIQNIRLSYNSDTNILHVSAKHRTGSTDTEYVDKMTVSLNGTVVTTLNYNSKPDPDYFSDNVPVKAKAGDVIGVQLFSNDGDNKSLDVNISDAQVSEAKSSNNDYSETIKFP